MRNTTIAAVKQEYRVSVIINKCTDESIYGAREIPRRVLRSRVSLMHDDSLLARVRRGRLSQTDSRVSGRDKSEELVAVLAHEGLHVMTRHVVPLDAVVVEVVQDRQAGLIVTLEKCAR